MFLVCEGGLLGQYWTIRTDCRIGHVHFLEQTRDNRNHMDTFYTEFKSNLAFRKHTIKLHDAFPFWDSYSNSKLIFMKTSWPQCNLA